MTKSISLILASAVAASLAIATVATSQGTTDKPATKQDTKKDEKRERREEKKEEKKGDKAELGKTAPNFTLKTTDGKDWSLSDAKGKVVVLEWVNPECPVCNRCMKDGTVSETVSGVKAIFPDVVYVAINSNAAKPSSLDATAKYLADNKMTIPALLDKDGKVGKMYGAATTPDLMIIDAKGILRYSGAIDNGDGNTKGKTNYVVGAAKQIKAGETVSPDSTKPYGCTIKY